VQRSHRLLIINPGSTSTKIGVYEDEKSLFEETLRHDVKELTPYARIIDQYPFRKQVILDALHRKGFNLTKFSAIVGRGGLLRPIPGGTYRVNAAMLDDLKSGRYGEHASNLGAILAYEIASQLNIPAFIVDPPVVDELEPLARISGVPAIERKSIFHALNQKAVARRVAKEMGKRYEEAHLIVAHMGGGISVGAHKAGRVVDVNNALDGEGPFAPERAGTVPAGDLVRLCFSGQHTQEEIRRMLVGKGGLVALLGTNDAREVERRVEEGDERAHLVYEAMAYQVAKAIGAAAAVLEGRIDAIILTGGLAYSKMFTDWIVRRVSWMAPVKIHPGENELFALAEGALRVLRGEEETKEYPAEEAREMVLQR